MFTVYSITPNAKEGEKDYWNPVGVGFENQDGSINLKLHMFPDLKLQVRKNKEEGKRNGK